MHMAESVASLSAAEVAALLRMNAPQPAEQVAHHHVVSYNFRKPDTLSPEQEESLRDLQSAFARNLAGSLSALLRSAVHVECARCATVRYDAFVAGLRSAVVTAVCSLPPLAGQAVLVLDPHMALVWVDRLMGGPGDQVGEARALTEIEVMLISRVFDRLSACWHHAWRHVTDIRPALDHVGSAAQLPQVMPGADIVMAFTFTAAMRNVAGEFQICVPLSILKQMLSKRREQVGEPEPDAATYAPEVADHLLATPVAVSVELGSAVITVGELLDLQVGDCVVLNSREGDALPVKVADDIRLWGRLGVVERNYAVSITRWDQEEEAALGR
jgi:flagellar motor switch protein FliM